jgi:hypothetical protein
LTTWRAAFPFIIVAVVAGAVSACAGVVTWEANRVEDAARSKLRCGSNCEPQPLYTPVPRRPDLPACVSTGNGLVCPAPTPSWRRYVPDRDAYGPGERG